MRDKLLDDQLVFRHKPSWETRYGDVRVTYNERRLRDRLILSKAAEEYRILALGESVTFGWGGGSGQDVCRSARIVTAGASASSGAGDQQWSGGYNTV